MKQEKQSLLARAEFYRHQFPYHWIRDMVKDKTVLEIGFNEGNYTKEISASAREVYAIDISRKAYEIGRAHV